MAAVDLLFSRALKTGNPVELVFGDDGGGGQVPDATLAVAARMPGLRVRSLVHVHKDLVAAGRMPGLRCSAVVRYNTDTPRPVVAEVAASAQQAQPVTEGWISGWQDTDALPAGWVSTAQDAMPLLEQFGVAWQDGQRQGVAVQGGGGATGPAFAWCGNAGTLAGSPGRAQGPAGQGPGYRAREGWLVSAVSGKPARPSPHAGGDGTGCDGPAIPIHHGRRPIGAAVPGL